MNIIPVSQLKINPAKAIDEASEYPVAVSKRSKVRAYLIGKNLYDKLMSYIEDYIDKETVDSADYKKGRDFDQIARKLGI